MKPIGKQIRQRREELGLTQAWVADKADMTRNLPSMIERDPAYNPTIDTLRKIADALDCDLVVKLKPRHDDAARHEERDDFYTVPGEGVVSIGVDYGAPDGDRTESVGIIRLGDQTLTVPVLFVDAPRQS